MCKSCHKPSVVCVAGTTQALFVLTRFHTSKFEFIFTNFVRDSPRLFTTIHTVFRAYDTSRMYRDLKLRGSLISDKELKLLPQEQIYSQVSMPAWLSSVYGVDCMSYHHVSCLNKVMYTNMLLFEGPEMQKDSDRVS